MANPADRLLVESAGSFLKQGLQVFVGRAGVADLVQIEEIDILEPSGLIVINPVGGSANETQYWAPGQIAVLKGVDTSNPLTRHMGGSEG